MSLLDQQLSYWKRRLVARLPDSYRVNKQTKTAIFRMSHEIVAFDQTLYAAIKRLAEREQCTPFTVLVGALSIALCDYTGNQDVIIATLAANRSTTQSECVIGHLTNTLILRFQVPLVNTIKQFLRQVRAQMIEAFAHQHFPFEELARVLELDTGLARESLCQVLFSYQYRYLEVRKCCGLVFAPFDLQLSNPEETIGLSTFDLILRVTATSTELTGTVNYRTESLSGARAHRVVQVFSKILRLMVSNPNESLSAALMQV
jgi:surfactin family lipopeptide synthetase A